ncbi:Transposable element Hobo transposase [Halotydeus destructor]|nr:Transposable element Hobo transposase [Halotydeus destructor]
MERPKKQKIDQSSEKVRLSKPLHLKLRTSLKPIYGKAPALEQFQRVLENEQPTAYVQCTSCLLLLVYQASDGTSSINSHSRTCSGPASPSLRPFLAKRVTAPASVKAHLADVLATWCAEDLRSFEVVTGRAFEDVCEELLKIGAKLPGIPAERVVPCSMTVERHVEALHLTEQTRLQDLLVVIEGLAIMVDHWVHDQSKTSYLTISIQCTREGRLLNRVLATLDVMGKTAEQNLAPIQNVLRAYGLISKPTVYVSDNASSMKKAFKNLHWTGCTAHQLNLVQKHAFDLKSDERLEDVLRLMDTCKSMVEHSKRTGLFSQLKKTLKQSIEVRWDSRYLMLKSINENREGLTSLATGSEQLAQLLVSLDWRLLQAVEDLLEPFWTWRNMLCSENVPTAHLPVLCRAALRSHLLETNSDQLALRTLKARLRLQLEERFIVTDIHLSATLLIPKYRQMKMVEGPTRDVAKSQIQDLLSTYWPSDLPTGDVQKSNSEDPFADDVLASPQGVHVMDGSWRRLQARHVMKGVQESPSGWTRHERVPETSPGRTRHEMDPGVVSRVYTSWTGPGDVFKLDMS